MKVLLFPKAPFSAVLEFFVNKEKRGSKYFCLLPIDQWATEYDLTYLTGHTV